MYVVAGASGNTGSVVVNHLLAAGEKVRGLSRNAGHLQWLVNKGGEAVAADLTNREALAEAFEGADAVYVMIPPDPTRVDFRLHQDAVSEAVAWALKRAKVKHAVSLSSIGADKQDKTGPVVGLRMLEQRLNSIDGLNALHLRAGYFMENTLMQSLMIQQMGMMVGPLLPELKLPMISTRDIGTVAAEALLELDFQPHETRELQGARDITMHEVATIVGKAIGKPELTYAIAQEEQVREGMQRLGMSANLTGLILEMASALNNGHMRALETRNSRNTTPTTYESFVEHVFVPYYQNSKGAAA